MTTNVWKDHKATSVRSDVENIAKNEQELIICDGRDEKHLSIDCTHLKWLGKLKKNPEFNVTEFLLSAEQNRVIGVKGYIRKNALTIRKKFPQKHSLNLPPLLGSERENVQKTFGANTQPRRSMVVGAGQIAPQ
jgi:hypothetical protein